ncbi:MAG: hypothetical protein JXR83_14290 [Deltaproteobacteria bacterium]|nr:hypothetical protein [Deltaproteobacteria bacterium]
MEGALFPAIAIGSAIGLVVIAVAVSSRQAKKRRAAWQAAAQQSGLAFLPEAQGVRDRLGGFKVCNLGRSRRAQNALVGTVSGHEIALFDYRYTTGSGNNRHTHHLSLCAVRHPELRLPSFFLRRQLRLWDALGKMFGGQDINFEEDAAFSRSFVLQGKDERAVRRVFGVHARAHLLRYQESALQLEGDGDTLLVNFGRRLDPDQGRDSIEQAIDVARIWTD